ncbi:MAG: tyrosine-type recombinase/integrase [Candidatus Marinimicrobia bacterium]|nr:tyrosine-type recombinase/integrase [Candidatus Neomarinimicrobiota bacterium]
MSTWTITPDKFLTPKELKALRQVIHADALLAKSRGRQIGYRDMVIIELSVSTGLRVGEISKLHVDDLQLTRKSSSLIVRSGKGGKTRTVQFGSELRKILMEYLEYRSPTSDFVFRSERQDQMTVNAIQKVFKKKAKKAGLPKRYSIHALRHTFCTMIYKASGYNLRMVSQMAGHASQNTSALYAAVLSPDVEKAVEKLESQEFLDSLL